jgi:hypothetical protein
MATDEAYIKLAERAGHVDSKLLHRILEKAMTRRPVFYWNCQPPMLIWRPSSR